VGALMKQDDIFIGTFLDLFNLRFAPTQGVGEAVYGGIAEMVALQREFQIFKKNRPFVDSAALLGLGGLTNNTAKNRWLTLLRELANYDSNKPGENGDQRIVNALIANLSAKEPLPCFMRAHDSRVADQRRVIVLENDAPIFYLDQKYLTISLPMRPRAATAARRAKT
jgi:hypothetical protein